MARVTHAADAGWQHSGRAAAPAPGGRVLSDAFRDVDVSADNWSTPNKTPNKSMLRAGGSVGSMTQEDHVSPGPGRRQLLGPRAVGVGIGGLFDDGTTSVTLFDEAGPGLRGSQV
mmetsp:Transcript_9233/g.28086  ORF Transcript_9233/g.28086 Transcript_9233/m.28086 type:complete len:115 (-) Transcript_9233:803-1147(-)